jgi:hypothetical protein
MSKNTRDYFSGMGEFIETHRELLDLLGPDATEYIFTRIWNELGKPPTGDHLADEALFLRAGAYRQSMHERKPVRPINLVAPDVLDMIAKQMGFERPTNLFAIQLSLSGDRYLDAYANILKDCVPRLLPNWITQEEKRHPPVDDMADRFYNGLYLRLSRPIPAKTLVRFFDVDNWRADVVAPHSVLIRHYYGLGEPAGLSGEQKKACASVWTELKEAGLLDISDHPTAPNFNIH